MKKITVGDLKPQSDPGEHPVIRFPSKPPRPFGREPLDTIREDEPTVLTEADMLDEQGLDAYERPTRPCLAELA
jgi:hypothetical protein